MAAPIMTVDFGRLRDQQQQDGREKIKRLAAVHCDAERQLLVPGGNTDRVVDSTFVCRIVVAVRIGRLI